jgi:excinuclease UvrABC nuclease subunit
VRWSGGVQKRGYERGTVSDVILIDGGKGQLAAAMAALKD